jgi:hypothetical protein
MKRTSILMATLTVVAACLVGAGIAQSPDEQTLATQVAQELIAACPPADPADPTARDRSAALLGGSALLRQALDDPILWGTQKAPGIMDPEESSLTRFNPFVWRKMYLSLFIFPGEFHVERVEPYTVLYLPCQFRNELDAGEYPYPFWHTPKKWEAWEKCLELRFVFQNGKVIAVMRSAEQDPLRSHVARVWDGKWHWQGKQGEEEPHVSLYQWLLSAKNPHVKRLESAYRALEEGTRAENCFFCHAPNNPVEMNPLRLLSFPNQALEERHRIIVQLEANVMPPGGGIASNAARQRLIALAKEFADAGDKALAYEGEPLPPGQP